MASKKSNEMCVQAEQVSLGSQIHGTTKISANLSQKVRVAWNSFVGNRSLELSYALA